MLANEQEVSDRTMSVKEETVRLLCFLCTVKTNRFYIPGETNMAERLRKKSFDKGIFATLSLIFEVLEKKKTISQDLKTFVKEKVLNLIELGDLIYHASVIECLMEKGNTVTSSQNDDEMNQAEVMNIESQASPLKQQRVKGSR